MIDLVHSLILPLSIAYVVIEARNLLSDLWEFHQRDRKPLRTAVYFFSKVTECSKCAGFWCGLALSQSLPIAVVCSVLFDVFDRFRMRYL